MTFEKQTVENIKNTDFEKLFTEWTKIWTDFKEGLITDSEYILWTSKNLSDKGFMGECDYLTGKPKSISACLIHQYDWSFTK